MLMEKTVGANGMIRELYVTISVYRKNVEDARNYFLRTGNGLIPISATWVPSARNWTHRKNFMYCTAFTGPERKVIFVSI